jgi:hypothetical protein
MLVTTKLGTGLFAVVWAGERISHLLFVAHPYHPAGRELLHADMAMRMLPVIRINKNFRRTSGRATIRVSIGKGVKSAPGCPNICVLPPKNKL